MMLREKIMFDFGWGWFFFASKKSEWNPEPINGIVMVGISLQKMVPLWQRRRADRNEDPRRAEVRPAPADRIGSAGNAPRLPTPSPPRRTSPINSPGPTYSTWRRVASSLQLETENELAASVTRLLSAKLWKILLIAFLFFWWWTENNGFAEWEITWDQWWMRASAGTAMRGPSAWCTPHLSISL